MPHWMAGSDWIATSTIYGEIDRKDYIVILHKVLGLNWKNLKV